MKIVILDGYTENPGDLSWSGFEALGELTVYDRTTDHSQIAERIGDAEAVYTNKTPISREAMAACPNLKYIGVLATGYNVVDVAGRNSGFQYSNLRNSSSFTVCDCTASGIVSSHRRTF